MVLDLDRDPGTAGHAMRRQRARERSAGTASASREPSVEARRPEARMLYPSGGARRAGDGKLA